MARRQASSTRKPKARQPATRRKTSARKPAARKRSSRQKPERQLPLWGWVVAATALALVIAAIIWLLTLERPSVHRPDTAQASRSVPPRPKPKPVRPAPIEVPKVEHKYDFYELLPKQTVDVSHEPYRDKNKLQPLLQPEAPPPRMVRGARFIVQAGSFRRLSDADHRRAQLALLGVESHIEKVRVNDGVWHRVKIGPFKSLEEANRLRTRLLSEKIQTMLVNVGK